MKVEKEKMGKLQLAVLVRTILPMLVMGALIIVVSMIFSRSSLEEESYRSLEAVASSVAEAYELMYPGDYELVTAGSLASLYKGEQELTGDFTYIDAISQSSGMDITLFYKDARILTTLKDENGNRYVGSGVHPAIMRDMENKMNVLTYRTQIGEGHSYYVCYVPLLNSDGSLIGMVGTAITAEEVQRETTVAFRPICIITILGLLIASFISIRYTRSIVTAVDSIHAFLSRMVAGKLSNELPDEVTKRGDEIGEIGGDIVRMQNAVRVLVECDPLTTLYNRRSGDARLKKIMRSARETGEPFCLCIGDIDFFKKVNDTYGHDAGDAVLKHVSKELKETMNGRGFAVRWGGEEFLLIFEDTDLITAGAILEDFLDRIRASKVVHGGQTIKITMTIGLVEGDPSRSAEDMTKEADGKLYFGKEHGRNQLVVTPGEEQPSYRELLAEEEEEENNSTVITFSEEILDSENLMQLMSDLAVEELGGEGGKD
ncbi:MAG: diguanylate cyclase [Lachnospiraceae bacterium]|nr:diguanylate cyclase [Lachnospiraceae bacterium]